MSKNIPNMSDEEYEAFWSKADKLERAIDHKSLLINVIGNGTVCPYCDSKISGLEEIREKLLQMMRDYNKLVGRKYYIAHVEDNKKWEL